MGLRIHQLPPAIANQIAAGEVIERPASVVKELLENSLDAGADVISIELGYGGLNQIKISDNGIGIDAEDLPLAISAHATSKITKLDDLYAIDSMGFRGEALASIASIAKVTISSKPHLQEHAMMLHIRGSEYHTSPCARNMGTTVDVVDLFYNAPVRKRFLKSEQLEFQAIETVVKRFALSAPHIALTMKHNSKLVLSLPSAVNEQSKQARMTRIFGSSFVKDAIYLDAECGDMHLHGWLSGPSVQRSQNDRQWIYINRRMVKDKLINHALKQSYEGLLHPGRFPACLLYFTINNAEVDVNVHPTKHEVRFQQPRLVHDFFTSQLINALKSRTNDNLDYGLSTHTKSEQDIDIREPVFHIDHYDSNPVLQSPLINVRKDKGCSDIQWTILNSRYVLLFIQQQPHIVDVIALYQRWLESQMKGFELPFNNRPLLVPISFSISQEIQGILVKLQDNLSQLGLKIEIREGTVHFLSVPVNIPYLDLRQFFESITQSHDLGLNNLIELLSQSQLFDSRSLSTEERNELSQLIMSYPAFKKQPFFKELTDDDCRMLLHV